MATVMYQAMYRGRPLANTIKSMATPMLGRSPSSLLLPTIRNVATQTPTQPIDKPAKKPTQPPAKQLVRRYVQPLPTSAFLPFVTPKLTPRVMITTSKPRSPYHRCYSNNVRMAVCRNPDNPDVLSPVFVTNGKTYTQGPPIYVKDLIGSSEAQNNPGPNNTQQMSKDKPLSGEAPSSSTKPGSNDIVVVVPRESTPTLSAICLTILGVCCNLWLLCILSKEDSEAEQLEHRLLETMLSRC